MHEDDVLAQLGAAVDAIALTEDLARTIAHALNEARRQATAAKHEAVERYELHLAALDTRENGIVDAFADRTMAADLFKRQRPSRRKLRPRRRYMLAAMYGFGGDRSREAKLVEALHRLLDVFPKYLAPAKTPTWFDPEEVRRNDQFDAIVRAHKRDRLTIPIGALGAAGSPYHNFFLMHLRRLAWFVPSLLSMWLEDGPLRLPSAPSARMNHAVFTIERILRDTAIVEGDDWKWTSEEEAALASFFDAALRAVLATPVDDSVGRAVETLRLASAMRVSVSPPLIEVWMDERTELAEEHLLVALTDDQHEARRLLVHEKVVERLREAFFSASASRAARLSAAEALVSKWLSQQPPA